MTPEETLISYQKTVIEKWVSRDPKAMEEYLNFLHPKITIIGTGLHEIIANKKEFTQLGNRQNITYHYNFSIPSASGSQTVFAHPSSSPAFAGRQVAKILITHRGHPVRFAVHEL